MSNERYKVASFFSGCGGTDVGLLGGFTYLEKKYRRLPFEIVQAIDINEKAVMSYNMNFKHKADVKDISKHHATDVPEVDVVFGGFPCQSFSTVNPTKNPLDERGQLYKHMARILKEKQPKIFVVENVKGMLHLHKGMLYKEIESEFSRAGYTISHRLLNAADYGIPQKRERVFMIGIRKDLDFTFTFPVPTHSKELTRDLFPWVGLESVITSLTPEDPKYYFSKRAVEGMKKAKNNMKRGLWQRLNEPSLTITAHLAKVSINSRDPVLLVDEKREVYRRFTPREAARIQSFPDTFRFAGSDSDAYRQIGEAIPPVLAWHVGNSIYSALKQTTLKL